MSLGRCLLREWRAHLFTLSSFQFLTVLNVLTVHFLSVNALHTLMYSKYYYIYKCKYWFRTEVCNLRHNFGLLLRFRWDAVLNFPLDLNLPFLHWQKHAHKKKKHLRGFFLNVWAQVEMLCRGGAGETAEKKVICPDVRERAKYSRRIKGYISVSPRLILWSPSRPHPRPNGTLCKMNTT